MKSKLYYLFIFTFLLLAGCRAETGPATQMLSTRTPTETATFTASAPAPTATMSPSPTNTLRVYPTRMLTPTVTPGIPPETKLNFQCLQVDPLPSDWIDSTGTIVLENYVIVDGRSQPDDYYLDMATGMWERIGDEAKQGIDYSVSPDRNYLAYNSYTLDSTELIGQDELLIVGADGQRLAAFPWEEGWVGIPGWLNNRQVVINISGLDPDESFGRKAATLLLLDPFSGERQILRPEFPNIYNTRPMYDWDSWSVTMYDPTLTRVVYLTDEGDFKFVLWDLEHEEPLASFQAVFPMASYKPIPRWSPDGSRFVVEAFDPDRRGMELFLVARDGHIEQLTHLYQYKTAHLASHSWSPDGRYLAAWLDLETFRDQGKVELVIVDTQTGEIVDYCVRIKYMGEGYGAHLFAPIWSPDGTQLIVMDRYEKDHIHVILVDVAKGYAVRIAEDMEPKGWMGALR